MVSETCYLTVSTQLKCDKVASKDNIKRGKTPHNVPEIHREIIWFSAGGVSTLRNIFKVESV